MKFNYYIKIALLVFCSFFFKYKLFSQNNPQNISNLKYWLSADSNLTLNGDKLIKWGNINNTDEFLYQSNSSLQPKLVENVLNNLPTIRFDGANDNLKLLFSDTITQPYSVSILFKSSNANTFWLYDGYDNNNNSYIAYDHSVDVLFAYAGSGISGYNKVCPFNDFIILTFVVNGVNSVMYENGIIKSSGNAGSRFLTGLTLGSRNNNTYFFHGDIAEIIIYNRLLSDEERVQVEQYLRNKYAPAVNLGADVVKDYGFCHTLAASTYFTDYLWSTGSTDSSITITQSGNYSVTCTDIFGFTSVDTVNVEFTHPVQVSLNNFDTYPCLNHNEIITSLHHNSQNNYTLQWMNGATTDSVNLTNYTGNIYLQVSDTNNCSAYSDTINISIDDFAERFSLGADTNFCAGNSLDLYSNPLYAELSQAEWSNGVNGFTNQIFTAGEYSVEVINNNGCLAHDTLNVGIIGTAPVIDFSFPVFCAGDSLQFTDLSTYTAPDSIISWSWNFADGTNDTLPSPYHKFPAFGNYNVRLTIEAVSGCSNSMVKQVPVYQAPSAFFSADTACVDNDYYFTDLSQTPSGNALSTWQWSYGNGFISNQQHNTYSYPQDGTYNISLDISDTKGCTDSYDTLITVVNSYPAPHGFTAVSPVAGYVSGDSLQIFSWNFSGNASHYIFQISNNTNFTDIAYAETTQDASAEYNFSAFGNYFWRIIAYNICGDSLISPVSELNLYNPLNTQQLSLWYNASNAQTDSLLRVSTLNDISGNNRNATQIYDSLQAFLIPDYLNSYPVIEFGKTGNPAFYNFTAIDIPSTQFTIAALIKVKDNANPVNYFLSGGSGLYDFGGIFTGGNLISGAGMYDGSSFIRSSQNMQNWNLIIFLNDKLYINGIEANYADYNALQEIYFNILGTRASAQQTQFFEGYLAEIMVYSHKLNQQEISNLQDYIRYKYFAPVNLGRDTALACGFCNYPLNAGEQYTSYNWSTGEQTQTLTANQTAYYTVSVTDSINFVSTDSVFVRCPSVSCLPSVNLGDDIFPACGFCDTTLDAGAYESYLWSTGDTTQTIIASQTGEYWVEVLDFYGYTSRDTVYVECPAVSCLPPVNLPPDTVIEYGFCALNIDASDIYEQYLWSTGDTSSNINVYESGLYKITVTDLYGFTSSDSVNVTFPHIALSDTIFCPGDTLTLNTGLGSNYSYFWSNTAMSQSIKVHQAGTVWVQITDTNNCIKQSPDFSIILDSTQYLLSFANSDTSLCSGNRIFANTALLPYNYIYNWSTGANTSQIAVNTSDTYTLTVTSENGCSASASINVTVIGTAPDVSFYYDTACVGSSVHFHNQTNPAGINSWHWDFGDGTFSTDQNPVHQYYESGEFEVVFTAFAGGGCSNNISQTVVFNQLPEADFTFNQVCFGEANQFTDMSTAPQDDEIAEWNWTFGNGASSQQTNPEYTYTQEGNYFVSLQVETDKGCTDSKAKQISISEDYLLPSDFNLLSPANEYYTSSNNLTFTWEKPSNLQNYVFELTSDSTFTNISHTVNLDTNIYNYNLSDVSSVLYWRVKATGICGNVKISPIHNIYKVDFSELPNLLAWYNADNVVSQSNKVFEISDISGNGVHITQEDTARQASVIFDSIVNNNVLNFTGTEFYSNLTASIPQPFSVVAVWKVQLTSGAKYLFDGLGNRTAIYYNGGNNRMYVPGGELSYTNSKEYNITTSVFNSFTSNYFDHGVLMKTGSLNNYSLTGFKLGSNSGSNEFLKGEIAELLIFNTAIPDSNRIAVEQYLRNKYSERVNLGNDITINYGFCDTTIDAGSRFESYLWSTGEETQTISVNRTGTYAVTVTDVFGYTSSDEIEVTFPGNNIFADTMVCYGDSVQWDLMLSQDDYDFTWSNGAQSAAVWSSGNDTLSVVIEDTIACSYVSQEYIVGVDSFAFFADLGPADTTLCIGNNIALLETSDEIVEYNWSTGSNEDYITVLTEGEYALTVENIRSCLSVDSINVNLLTESVPSVDFTYNRLCAFSETEFTADVSGSVSNYYWYVNDESAGTGSSITYEFDSVKTERVTLEIESSNGCQNSITKELQLHHLPNPAFTPDRACQGEEVLFINQSSDPEGYIENSYWNIDGQEFVNTTPNYTFNNAGIYQVSLRVENNYACESILTRNIDVFESITPQITWSSACFGTPVYFTDETEFPSYILNPQREWVLNTGDTVTMKNPFYSYPDTGTYNISYELQLNTGCNSSIDTQLYVSPIPEVEFSVEDICFGDSLYLNYQSEYMSLLWKLNNTNLSSQNPIYLSNLDTGDYEIMLEVTNPYGCRNTGVDSATVHPLPTADFSVYPQVGAIPMTVNPENNSQGAIEYFWTFKEGEISTDFEPEYVYQDSGDYTIKLIAVSEYACADSMEKNIQVIVPEYDIAVSDIQVGEESGYLKIVVSLINYGSIAAENIQLVLNPEGKTALTETIEEAIAPGTQVNYTFRSSYQLPDGQKPAFICVEANYPVDSLDANLSNNRLCLTNVTDFMLFEPYPNPARSRINVDYIIPVQGSCEIRIVNSLGRVVLNEQVNAREGLNQKTLNIHGLNSGIYSIVVYYNDKKEVKNFMVY